MNQNGKGSKRRPKNVDYETWEKNYERVFGVREKPKSKTKRSRK